MKASIYFGNSVFTAGCFLVSVVSSETLSEPRREIGIQVPLGLIFFSNIIFRALPAALRDDAGEASPLINFITFGGQLGMTLVALALLFGWYEKISKTMFIIMSIASLFAWFIHVVYQGHQRPPPE
jgi:hypothetical protein